MQNSEKCRPTDQTKIAKRRQTDLTGKNHLPLEENQLSYKVSFRNIFRYKKRFFMMVLGISGCTALLPHRTGRQRLYKKRGGFSV